MSVLERTALQESPLADLHAIASELSIDGYRRLRREQLINAILERQGDAGAPDAEAAEADAAEASAAQEPAAKEPAAEEPAAQEPAAQEPEGEGPDERPRRRRGRRGGRSRGARAAETEAEDGRSEQVEPSAEEGLTGSEEDGRGGQEQIVEGEVELLPNGSAFLRLAPPEASDDDVYISAAQVKRCELISGDRISGPRRAPRRSERFASLYRIDTVNGQPATELADGVRFDELPARFPQERLELGSEDPTVTEINRLTPIGKGSRVTISGPARAGKSEALRRVARALADDQSVQTYIVLAGVRPEEIAEWSVDGITPAQALSFAASADAQSQAVGAVIDQARRLSARGADAVVLIDTLDGLHPVAAHKALAAARNILDGGSLTVIATASQPLGGETTVIALDPTATALGRDPAIDPELSGVWRPEVLLGEEGAAGLIRAREEALRRTETARHQLL